jgi:hypothetical protein
MVQKQKEDIKRLHDKFYGPGSKHAKKKEKELKSSKKQESQTATASHLTRNEMVLEAKKRGIKYFRIMNKVELTEVLDPKTTPERVSEIQKQADARWKSGWSKK